MNKQKKVAVTLLVVANIFAIGGLFIASKQTDVEIAAGIGMIGGLFGGLSIASLVAYTWSDLLDETVGWYKDLLKFYEDLNK